MPLSICFFGIYNKKYSRNRSILQYLKNKKYNIIECHSDLSGLSKYFDLSKKLVALKGKYDALWVGFNGFSVLFLAKIFSDKKIIFDAFSSLYVSEVLDRKKANFLMKLKIFFIEYLSYRMADIILYDTEEQVEYVSEKFKINKDKFIVLPPLPDKEIFYPDKSYDKKDEFLVHWHGKIVPFHGIDIILKSAEIVQRQHPDIKLQIIIDSKNRNLIEDKMKKLNLKNIYLYDNVEYEDLPKYIQKADICLGVFGGGVKFDLVVPNKIYECLMCGKIAISSLSKALEGVFGKNDDCFIDKNNPEKLAEKIAFFYNHRGDIDTVYRDFFSPKIEKIFEKYEQNFSRALNQIIPQ